MPIDPFYGDDIDDTDNDDFDQGDDDMHHSLQSHSLTSSANGLQQYIGDPLGDAEFWQHQTTPFSCAVQAQRGILEAVTGQDFSEAQLSAEAAEIGVLSTGIVDGRSGTSPEALGELLSLHGVESHVTEHATVGDLMSELAAGHKVIVGVHAGDLWTPDSLDNLLHRGADHAIWVTGVDVSDPEHLKVLVNDSGDPHGCAKSYELDQFLRAWDDSDHFLVATNHAPPDLHLTCPDFDTHTGAFTTMLNWARAHALPLTAGTVAVAAGGLAFTDVVGRGRLAGGTGVSLSERVRARAAASEERLTWRPKTDPTPDGDSV